MCNSAYFFFVDSLCGLGINVIMASENILDHVSVRPEEPYARDVPLTETEEINATSKAIMLGSSCNLGQRQFQISKAYTFYTV